MYIICDDSANDVLKNFNMDVYNNFEEIIQLLLAGFSFVDVNFVFVVGIERRKLCLFCGDYLKEFQLSFEYKDEFHKDCLIFENLNRKFRYEFDYNKEANKYSLKLLEIDTIRKNKLNSEVCFYRYGKHINVYYKEKIYSFDLQGNDINFDFYLFENMISEIKNINLDNLSSCVCDCVSNLASLKLFVCEYKNNYVVRNMTIFKGNVEKVRVLRKKKSGN